MSINWSFPIIDQEGKGVQSFRNEMNKVFLLQPLTGTGSPEGNVEARLFQIYLDKTGGAGAIEYRKMLSDIGGDTKKGWQAV